MKCMHKHDMHDHKDVDDFLVFEHVCVIKLKVDYFVFNMHVMQY